LSSSPKNSRFFKRLKSYNQFKKSLQILLVNSIESAKLYIFRQKITSSIVNQFKKWCTNSVVRVKKRRGDMTLNLLIFFISSNNALMKRFLKFDLIKIWLFFQVLLINVKFSNKCNFDQKSSFHIWNIFTNLEKEFCREWAIF